MVKALFALLAYTPFLALQQGAGLEDQILDKGDKLLEEAKTAYEDARSRNSVPAFVEAGFKLEEARIKFIVLQEIGSPDKQKTATDRLRAINQLGKLIHDGKVAIAGSPADAPSTPANPPAIPNPRPGDPAPSPPADSGPPPIDVTKRAPPPDATKLRAAEKALREIYKDDYAKKTQADHKTFARALLAEVRRNRNDLPSAWVLCRESQDQAIQGCDVTTALMAIEVAAELFDVDGMLLRNAALLAAAKTVKTPEEASMIVTASFKMIDEFLANDQYESAEKLAASMLPLAKKTGSGAVVTQMTIRAKDVTDAKGLYQGMKGVLEALAKTPDDPPANSEMGKFLCLVKGNWELGLRFIAKGSDPLLKTLAEKELANSESSSDRVAIADQWHELAEKEKSGLRKTQLLAHSRSLYEAALVGATGLLRTKIEKILDTDAAAAARGTPGPGTSSALSLLPLIDLKMDTTLGVWKCDGKTLISPADKHARIQLPYIPPDEYDLSMEIVRTQKEGAAILGLIGGGNQFIMICDGWDGDVGGLDQVDNKTAIANETCIHRRLFEIGKPTPVVCSVRKDGVSITVGGAKAINWKGGFNRLSLWGDWKMNRNDTLFLATHEGVFKFSKVTIVEPSDKGKRVR